MKTFVFLTLFYYFVNAFQANENPVIQTMEEFSGYVFREPTSSFPPPISLSVHSDTLYTQIEELSAFSDTPPPSVTRIVFTPNDVAARLYIKTLMSDADLTIREDDVGNIFGRWEGEESDIPAVASGSHIDAIPYAGKYDGVIGVLGAVEAINALKRGGFRPRRSIEVVMFTSEEPTRFGIGCLGSRLLAGNELLAERLKTTVDNKNVSFLEAARAAGYANGGEIGNVSLKKGEYAAFIELHIEQGPILEAEGVEIGIVTAIAAPASIKVAFDGNGGHAGTVLMPDRNDAGLAAAELAIAVEKHVLESGSIDTVGTVGVIEIHPGAVNSIPSKSRLEIDARDIDEERRDGVVEKIRRSSMAISENRGVKLSEFKIVNKDPPAHSDELVIEAMEAASRELNLTHKYMISRAYHDSLFMARVSPTGMIFIPCFRGYSHRPEEFASSKDMENGVKVLALALAKLSVSP